MATKLVSAATLRLWSEVLRRPDEEFYGLELSSATGLGPGTLYPILRRLVEAGYLVRREDSDKVRVYYRLTPVGYQAAVNDLGPYQIVGPALPLLVPAVHGD